MPFTHAAKRVLELALEQSGELGHDLVGGEHLLLGLLRLREGIASRALASAGVTFEAARNAVRELRNDE
jgi:ATP-dependent Clp protease ATP-binding subunit ClpC